MRDLLKFLAFVAWIGPALGARALTLCWRAARKWLRQGAVHFIWGRADATYLAPPKPILQPAIGPIATVGDMPRYAHSDAAAGRGALRWMKRPYNPQKALNDLGVRAVSNCNNRT